MKQRFITVHEHGELPRDLDHKLIDRLHKFDTSFVGKGKKSPVFQWGRQSVKANHYVGVVQIPGLTVEILPKIDRDGVQSDQLAQKNLLYMLSYTRNISFEARDLAALTLKPMPLMEILIKAFAEKLLSELRRGLDHAYINQEENLPRIKGKLLMNRHILLNAAHRERFYVGYDDFVSDTPLNRILKATTRRLTFVTVVSGTQKLLLEALAVFDDAADVIPQGYHFAAVHLHRNNERFTPLLDFCHIVWQGQSPAPSAGESETFSFLFNMHELFEEFIAQFILRNAGFLGLHKRDIRLQTGIRHLCWLQQEDSAKKVGKFQLKPDILIGPRHAPSLIIDTKWKRLKSSDEDDKNGVSQADMYQMYAYSQRYQCNDVVLLYPKVAGVEEKVYLLEDDDSRRIHIGFVDVSRDLGTSAGSAELLHDLQCLIRRSTPLILQKQREQYTGCLLGGAVGDALGWPVEFAQMSKIIRDYGPEGIRDLVPGAEELFEITDDTQMTLFTGEGLLRAWAGARHNGDIPNFAAATRLSYLCWLETQGESPSELLLDGAATGWLLGVEELHQRRAPGNTCISALREGVLSEEGIANNNSKGCGGIMRAAPAGLLATRIHNGDALGAIRLAFEIGSATAALTHGHPSGYYPAGVLAAVIATIVTDGTITEGIDHSLGFLANRSGSQETTDAIRNALDLWQNPEANPSPEVIETLGGGWVGEEALAIGLYCALVAGDDFAKGVRLAVNHSGDSDSTGSITGNIMGALLGEEMIPAAWLNRLELHDIVRQVGEDLFDTFQVTAAWLKRYPPL